jgi:hypothetical protein
VHTTPPPDVSAYKWELYNVKEDPTQFNDLAAQMPEKIRELQAVFDSEAKKYNVLWHYADAEGAAHLRLPCLAEGHVQGSKQGTTARHRTRVIVGHRLSFDNVRQIRRSSSRGTPQFVATT